MHALFLPATLLMNRLGYLAKFVVLTTVFAATCWTFLGEILWNQWQSMSQASSKEHASRTIPALIGLLDSVQRHRGISAAVLGGNADMAPQLAEAGTAVDTSFRALEDAGLVRRYPAFGDPLQRARQGWDEIRSGQMTTSRSFQAHTDVAMNVLVLVERFGNESGLAVDADLRTHVLANAATAVIPPLAETYGRIRGIGVRALAGGTIAPEESALLAALLAQAADGEQRLAALRELVLREDPVVGARLSDAVGALHQARQTLSGTVAAAREGKPVSPATYFEDASRPVKAAYQLMDEVLAALTTTMATRSHDLLLGMVGRVALAILASLIVLYLLGGFYVSMRQSAGELNRVAKAFASGDFSQRVRIASRDEIASIADGFNAMADSVAGLLEEVRGGVRNLDDSVSRLSESSGQVVQGSREQSEAAQSTSAAVEQMSVSIGHVAENVEHTVTASQRAQELSTSGERTVRDAVEEFRIMAEAVHASSATIARLSDHSSRVTGIVRIIRDVADQTNLLALNAAIEAARAGELGRGFAVVADEVRQLAERTAAATTEISAVIESIEKATQDSVTGMQSAASRVENGVEQANHAAATLSEIHGGTAVTLERIAEMAAATRQQSSASQDIARHVESIARRAEENTLAVRDIASASQQVAAQTHALAALVGRFRTSA